MLGNYFNMPALVYIYHFSNVGILVNIPMIPQYKTTDIPVLFQNWYFTFFSCALPALSVVLTPDKQNICLQIEFLSSLFDQGT